ncbi:ACP S-malonyltransferase [Legionella micdadei]|uniref:Malonyl CoA-acyl carrier protein transacylase n=1 Tax=Legionella micdadei TaxID=451 RepID=A0A098GEX9_LEGMI|nr:ACP S-malonyltransferase [Legionella micdadei]ARG97483.1 malonyl CoA-acyl carrier protein transacylase [Legionella micdadei]ARH00207.1 malonyl CoA-acyl carrier protein transacylase [Legionella micdadei]KTD28380.1 malonyl CoA-ACP transacylase [Legionella micdadei]CEG61028.1 Malonyl CoA-acyl carrier protein transacylase [Legionella micdadei]SCY70706.1 [acyl-carrier-protein] S-malonyltransferase [Legionella micdadei]
MFKLAYVFPGQGSQHVGMLSELAERYSFITDCFKQVSDELGYDLWQLVQQGPESQLNQTEYTQVAMLTADVAVFTLLQKQGVARAHMMAGHSLGEYAALVCANAISLADAAQLVAKRGQLMQSTVPLGQGAMAAIVGLTDEQVQSVCAQASTSESQVTPANYNALGQVVIAGHSSAVERAVRLAEEMEARLAKIIPVSVPCHCPLLVEAAAAFEEYLAKANFTTPEGAVISNVDLSIYRSVDQIRSLLKEQLYRPVRWVETIQLMKKNDIDHVVECGPGKVLSGLIKRIERGLLTMSVNDNASLEQALDQFNIKETSY